MKGTTRKQRVPRERQTFGGMRVPKIMSLISHDGGSVCTQRTLLSEVLISTLLHANCQKTKKKKSIAENL